MESIWNRTCSISPRDSLKEDRKAETVIIGAGMTGILTAYLLKKRGISSIILEAGRIGGRIDREHNCKNYKSAWSNL